MLIGTTIRVHHKSREESDEKDFDAIVEGFDAQGLLQVRNKTTGATSALSGQEVSISPNA